MQRSAREIIERRVMIEKTDAYRTMFHADRDCQHGVDAADGLNHHRIRDIHTAAVPRPVRKKRCIISNHEFDTDRNRYPAACPDFG